MHQTNKCLYHCSSQVSSWTISCLMIMSACRICPESWILVQKQCTNFRLRSQEIVEFTYEFPKSVLEISTIEDEGEQFFRRPASYWSE